MAIEILTYNMRFFKTIRKKVGQQIHSKNQQKTVIKRWSTKGQQTLATKCKSIQKSKTIVKTIATDDISQYRFERIPALNSLLFVLVVLLLGLVVVVGASVVVVVGGSVVVVEFVSFVVVVVVVGASVVVVVVGASVVVVGVSVVVVVVGASVVVVVGS